MKERMTSKMVKFPAYGMAGVGIAAAIGFIFALSFFANYYDDGDADSGLMQQQQQEQQQSRTQPSSLFVQQQEQQNVQNRDGDDGADGRQDMAARSMDSAENETAADGGESASLMMQQSEEATSSSSLSLQPTLVSIIAHDGDTGGIIGEVVPNMEFEAGRPVFIKANLVNLNSIQISDNVIALGISSSDSDDEGRITGSELESGNSNRTLTQRLAYEQASSFRGNIGAGENIELELYWNPVRAEEYTLLLFSVTSNDLTASTTTSEPVAPVASIPIKVVVSEPMDSNE